MLFSTLSQKTRFEGITEQSAWNNSGIPGAGIAVCVVQEVSPCSWGGNRLVGSSLSVAVATHRTAFGGVWIPTEIRESLLVVFSKLDKFNSALSCKVGAILIGKGSDPTELFHAKNSDLGILGIIWLFSVLIQALIQAQREAVPSRLILGCDAWQNLIKYPWGQWFIFSWELESRRIKRSGISGWTLNFHGVKGFGAFNERNKRDGNVYLPLESASTRGPSCPAQGRSRVLQSFSGTNLGWKMTLWGCLGVQ